MRLLGDVLASEGYKLVDDAWIENERRTYIMTMMPPTNS